MAWALYKATTVAALIMVTSQALAVQEEPSEPDDREVADRAICAKVGVKRPPASDLPNPNQAKALKGCDTDALYYGIGMKRDVVRARQCAMISDGGDPASLFQFYANGDGVRRDLDVATSYACSLLGQSGAAASIILALEEARTRPRRIEFCDFAVSTIEVSYCFARDSRIADVARDAKINAIVSRGEPAARGPYSELRKMFEAFVKAADEEVDQTGTMRGSLVMEAENDRKDQFLEDLKQLRNGHWPTMRRGLQIADRELNRMYRKALAEAGNKAHFTTTKPKDIRNAQRAWLVYRDAFVRYATVVAPAVSTDSIAARLTRRRIKDLSYLQSYIADT